ncbi:MAG: phosphopeptide-binding protein [SAR324 cluster bacterium]|nr:phosphopeptide-binding protein [SAR324 cluster bacterium]
MSTLMRKLVFGIIGLLAGLAAWPAAELILTFQSAFPTYLVFTVTLGVFFGGIMGGFLGSVEGITLSIRSRILPGIITGILVGAVGGAVGFLIGQGALFLVSDMFFHSNKTLHTYGIPIARTIGWGFLGFFIGTVEGVRARSWMKIKVGMLGGIAGGLMGGFVIEYLRILYPHFAYTRLIGLLILGFLIGLFYGLFEKRFSQGMLKLLNGKLKGKEYLLVQKAIRVGTSEKTDIQLTGYRNVADIHALLKSVKGEIVIKNVKPENRVLVNELNITEEKLKFEDVVQIGTAKFLFLYK